jgi:hypothetical protein
MLIITVYNICKLFLDKNKEIRHELFISWCLNQNQIFTLNKIECYQLL